VQMLATSFVRVALVGGLVRRLATALRAERISPLALKHFSAISISTFQPVRLPQFQPEDSPQRRGGRREKQLRVYLCAHRASAVTFKAVSRNVTPASLANY
jgi:hypothetical protein